MSKSCETVVAVVPQRRRNRAFMALTVAPKCARPAALRELYTDAGSIIRNAAPEFTTSRPS
ncbi:hypothetical protein [Actinokineospora diospyrosa]|uniref:DDE superfamily endonuclease n=1 Tax=Actinokineospora diospyrosa TaxID=103728 RepID=A0ABT1IH68_9PSEU|nr:hypothetical protein [Actinokineospora diospyrosa]MCP2271988.1 hypothetical protein [Actinokineospora diospyrosa]